MTPRALLAALALLLAAGPLVLKAQDTKVIQDFESEDDLKLWEFKATNDYFKEKPAFNATLVEAHATSGKKAMKVAGNEYMMSWKFPGDWSGYDALEIDIFLEGDGSVGGSLLIGDQAWKDKKSTYWNRHNGTFNLKPGANTLSIPVNGLFRGEAGSRNNDIKQNIDPAHILRFDIGFNPRGEVKALYLDHVRLVKESRPDGIQAYDFGPESQTVFPGFTPVSWNTVYGQNGCKAGLNVKGYAPNQARDDTFPTRLYQDFIEMNGFQFVADAPNGLYHVWVVFDDCGYWGGEQAKHRRRSITANGKEAWVDDRGESGPADGLFRFENIEPKPGDSLWELYMKDLFKPARFDAEVTDGKLNLHFKSDAGWSCKVAGVIVYSEKNKAEAEKWVAEVEARNRKEFEARALFMGPKQEELKVPDAAKAKGYWLGFPSLEENVSFVSAPGKDDGKLARTAAKGQRISYTFAVRPLKDFGAAALEATDLKGPGGTIPAAAVDLRYVMNLTQRGFNDIAYTIAPESLRPVAGASLALGKDLTRQFWITVAVPADAKPGSYSGEVKLAAGDLKASVPLTVEVLDVALDEPDFDMGFFGFHVPGELPAERRASGLKELFALLKQSGMNSVSGGPGISFKGFKDGKPDLDYGGCDAFFKTAREAGYTRTMHAYGGPGMVHGMCDGYTIGATGEKWAKELGKPFSEVVKLVYGAVKEHAEKENWLPVAYYFCDEPRVEEGAREHVKFMQAFREGAPWVNIGGGYSVHWGDSPLDKAIQDIFKTLTFSNLNSHTEKDMQMAKELGKDIYIYNQGTTRYTFGAYQWAEMRKGVKGRMQWHLLALHGYQYFDLDGREPDTAMINWGKDEIHPTIHLHRCREGADDFRWAVTLWNLAEKKKGTPDAKAAQDFLEDVNKKIGIGQNRAPSGWMGDEAFRDACIGHVKKLLAK
ncbi:MAG: hypothetical protein KIS92_24460 [Planctomycetota bacterium]|nr:hypothetical protein [Planctomycetota bacterium]